MTRIRSRLWVSTSRKNNNSDNSTHGNMTNSGSSSGAGGGGDGSSRTVVYVDPTTNKGWVARAKGAIMGAVWSASVVKEGPEVGGWTLSKKGLCFR